MKVWAVTLDVSTLTSPAFETVRGHWHVYLPSPSGCRFDLTSRHLPFGWSLSSIIRGDYNLWMSPLERRSRSSFEGRMHSVGFFSFGSPLISLLLLLQSASSNWPSVEIEAQAVTRGDNAHRFRFSFLISFFFNPVTLIWVAVVVFFGVFLRLGHLQDLSSAICSLG